MKINPSWILVRIIGILCIIFMGYVYYSLSSMMVLSEYSTVSTTPMKLICILAIIVMIIFIFTHKEKYKTSYLIPKENFTINRYKNFDVWSYNGDSWICMYNKEKFFNKTHIKATIYYNRKRKEISTTLELPRVR